MTSNRLAGAGSLVLALSISIACGGNLVSERGSEGRDGGSEAPRVDARAPGVEGGSRPSSRSCPAGFVLEGGVCARWVFAGQASCDSTSTRLQDGRVVCPSAGNTLTYDPVIDDFGESEGLHAVRSQHTATLLADGRVLVAGGIGADGLTLKSVEIFDPSDELWHTTTPMAMSRRDHAAALLNDGRVLVVGGAQGEWPNEGALASAEIFDPTMQEWTPAASLSGPRTNATASSMTDGAILVLGGASLVPQAGFGWLSTAQTYDAAKGIWQAAPSLPGALFETTPSQHTATVLPDGSLLVVGIPGGVPGPGAALLNPARTAWQETAPMPELPFPVTSLLPNGSVLVVWTDVYESGPSHAVVYDPEHDSWTATQNPAGWYYGGTATLLVDGSVLVVSGGLGGTAERYVITEPL